MKGGSGWGGWEGDVEMMGVGEKMGDEEEVGEEWEEIRGDWLMVDVGGMREEEGVWGLVEVLK